MIVQDKDKPPLNLELNLSSTAPFYGAHSNPAGYGASVHMTEGLRPTNLASEALDQNHVMTQRQVTMRDYDYEIQRHLTTKIL